MVKGPIIFGQIQTIGAKHHQISERSGALSGMLALLGALFAMGCIALSLAALLHHYFAVALWALLVIAPTPVAAVAATLFQHAASPDEHSIAVIDWLKHLPPMQLFGADERARLVWLTPEGLYTYTGDYYPRGDIWCSSLDTGTTHPEDATTYHLDIRVREQNALKRILLWIFLGLLMLTVAIAGVLLSNLLPRHGLRDDVFALIFAASFNLFAWYRSLKVYRQLEDEHRDGRLLAVAVNPNHVLLEDLKAFVKRFC